MVSPCRFCENFVCNKVEELTKESDPFRSFQVVCDACKARGPVMRSEQMAMIVWNNGVSSL